METVNIEELTIGNFFRLEGSKENLCFIESVWNGQFDYFAINFALRKKGKFREGTKVIPIKVEFVEKSKVLS